eukprot:jgi/Astpho2/7067/fgenesh1_pm.00107_%23_31_t
MRASAAIRLGTALTPGTAMRMGTAGGAELGERPMTSNKGAGYSSGPRGRFDPLNQAATGRAATPLAKVEEASPDEQCREAEAKVHVALDESAQALRAQDASTALERAKDAVKRERGVVRLREQLNLLDQLNLDLQFGVAVNLAHMYAANQLYREALNAYTQIIKGKTHAQAGRLRVNMGNIYFEQRKFPAAIKMYRMALDQVPPADRSARMRMLRNIAIAFIKLGQYQDAMQAFEQIMETDADYRAGLNLVVCCFAIGDKERMKQAFVRLAHVRPGCCKLLDELEEDDSTGAELEDVHLMNDELKQHLRRQQAHLHRSILTAARLIAPVIDRGGFVAGFNWCAEVLTAAGHSALANEAVLAKATMFLEQQEVPEAIEVLKEFERKEHHLKARAATNLSFLHHLEGEQAAADRYAQLAVATDRYSAQALVNKGSVAAAAQDWEGARALFSEALQNEADCVEALYNLGLVYRQTGDLGSALADFQKLAALAPENTEVMWQIGAVLDLLGEPKAATEWFERLHSHLPQDPGVLARLGALHAKLDDEAEALRYHQESHRVYPVDMEVISWLGAFHVKNEVYEGAVPYFSLAARVQPHEVKWQLMVASCYRRIGNYQQALAEYRRIHAGHPLNVECLRYLIHICSDLGMKEDVQLYSERMRKAERLQQAEQKAKKAQLTVGKEEDEWGTDELGDELLPL